MSICPYGTNLMLYYLVIYTNLCHNNILDIIKTFFVDDLEPSYLQFFGDDFLRLVLLRYVFCDVVLHLHRAFKSRQYRPRCQPPLPEAELLEHPSLQHLVLDLAAHLEVRTHFMDNHEIDWSRAYSSWPCVGFRNIRSTSWRHVHEDELNISRSNVNVFFVLRVTFFVVLLLWLMRNTHFLGSFVNTSKFFWILFVQDSLVSLNSQFCINAIEISSKCSLLPVLINELANFRSLAKVKQKLSKVSHVYASLLRYTNFSAKLRRDLPNRSYFWTPFSRVFANLSIFNTVIIT